MILQHSFANCSRLLRCQCPGHLAAPLPTPSHGESGVSTARAWVNTYPIQLISCTLVLEPRINMMDPATCWSLGQRLGSPTRTEGSPPPRSAAQCWPRGPDRARCAPRGLQGGRQRWAPLKTDGRRNFALQDPRGFTVTDLPFHSHETSAGFNHQNKTALNSQGLSSYFQESDTMH